MFKRDEHETSEVETIIGPSVKVEGDFTAAGNVVIEGAVSGTLKTDRFLKVGERANITADVQAGSAYISGEIHGNILVMDSLELTATAKIYGDIKSKALTVSAGAVIEGKCEVVNSQKSMPAPKIEREEKKMKERKEGDDSEGII